MPLNTHSAWLTSVGQSKIDLHQLYELVIDAAGVDPQADPPEVWSSISASLCGGKLSGDEARQLYSQHLHGFEGERVALLRVRAFCDPGV